MSSTNTWGGALGCLSFSLHMSFFNKVLVMGIDCLEPAKILLLIISWLDENEQTCITLGAKCCWRAKLNSTGGYSSKHASLSNMLMSIVSKTCENRSKPGKSALVTNMQLQQLAL